MQTSLTDQLFKNEQVSLTDQLFPTPEPEPEPESKVDVKGDVGKIQRGLHAEAVGKAVEKFEGRIGPYGGAVGVSTLTQSVEEFDRLKANPILSDKFKEDFVETVKGYGELAAQPIEALRGAAQFLWSLPGFGLGIVNAGRRMTERMGRPANLSDLYDAASEGMGEVMEYWHEKMVEPVFGATTPATELVGATAMAPALVTMDIGHRLADKFEGYPNVQGALRFTADIGGLVALGKVMRGSKAETTQRVETVTKKAAETVRKQEIVDLIPDETLKRTQQRILDAEKNQLEMEAAEIAKDLDYGQMIREDLVTKSRRIKQVKQAKKYSPDEAVDAAMKKIPEEKVEVKAEIKAEPVSEPVVEAKPPIVEKAKLKKKKEPPPEEPVTEVDELTGRRLPELDTQRSPFREDVERTDFMKRWYEENKWDDSIEHIIGKYTNDVNRWLDGESVVNIEAARNSLSQAAIMVKDPSSRMQLLDAFNGNQLAVNNFIETVGEAASWARRAERTKAKRPADVIPDAEVSADLTRIKALEDHYGKKIDKISDKEVEDFFTREGKGVDWFGEGIDLNIAVPVQSIPKVVGELIRSAKVKYRDIYRNKEIFDKTGFWIDRQWKWNYEIDDSKMKLTPSYKLITKHKQDGIAQTTLGNVLDYPELYRKIPEARDFIITFDKSLEAKGESYGNGRMRLREIRDIKTLAHELQHEIGGRLGWSKYAGTTPERAGGLLGYLKDPGEMMARLTEKRLNMSAERRLKEPPWETLDRMLVAEKWTKDIRISREHGHKLMTGVDPAEAYKSVTDTLKSLRNVVSRQGRKQQYGKGPLHGADISDLPAILEKGLRPGSALDTGTQWVSEYPVVLSVPGAKLGEYVPHNKYYMSAETAKPRRVTVDLEHYNSRIENKIRTQIADLAVKHPEVEFVLLNESGKPYQAKHTVESLTKMYEEVTEMYGKKDPRIAEYRAEIDRIREPYKDERGIYRNVHRTINERVEQLNKDIEYLERDYRRKIKQAEDRIREAEADVSFTEGVEFYSGVPLDKLAKEIVSNAQRFKSYTERAEGLKKVHPIAAAKRLRAELNRSFIDRSGNIRQDLLNTLGGEGYNILQKMYLSKGASTRAAKELRQMQKEIYGGLSKNEKRVLDRLILADRMIDIGRYKSKKQFKFPDDITPERSIAYSELFQQIEKLDPIRSKEIRERARGYFEWMKKPLQDMLDAGLINQAEFEALSSHNYRRLKLVDIFDRRYRQRIGAHKRTVYDSGVEALAKGRGTDVFEPSSEIMALEVFNRAYGRIANNAANQSLAELARSNKDNPFVRVKESRSDSIPKGWQPAFFYEGGQRKVVHLNPEFAKEWITHSPEVSYKLSNFLRVVSGSAILRPFATGINWAFALVNLPRDVMHSWFAARVWKDGKWHSLYNTNLPVFAMQMGRDQATVFTDSLLRRGRYHEYIDQGGGMEFLVHQGRLLARGKRLESPLDKIQNFLGYIGETSEIMTRLSIRERVLRRRAREEGISVEEARKNPEIAREASFTARDYLDFGQGGGIAKAVDNAVPYLNAGIQGTRGMFRAMKENPVASGWKLTQLAGITTGVYLASTELAPNAWKALKESPAMEGNLCLPLPESFAFEDEQGQIRYPYIKIPLDHGQRFFKTLFDAANAKMLGEEVDVDRVVKSLKNFSPVDVTELPPTMSALIGYITNKDFWLNEDIWRGTDKPFSYPQSKEEHTRHTPQAFVDIGQATGLSPERLRFALSEVFAGETMYSYMVGKGYDELLGDLPKDQKEQHFAEALAKNPFARRFIGITNPYVKHARVIDETAEKNTIDRFVATRELDTLVDGYLYKEAVTREEVFKYINSFKDRDERDRLKERFKWEESIKMLPEKSFWRRMKNLDTKSRAEVFAKRVREASESEKGQLWREYAIISRAGGVISEEFRKEFRRELSKEVD